MQMLNALMNSPWTYFIVSSVYAASCEYLAHSPNTKGNSVAQYLKDVTGWGKAHLPAPKEEPSPASDSAPKA